jgi:hypothetical protein
MCYFCASAVEIYMLFKLARTASEKEYLLGTVGNLIKVLHRPNTAFLHLPSRRLIRD